ncbi:DNA polymerase III alpha subunit [Candidatus Vidania fulgoroideae]|nr:DNA polymerase III alpha subunit [Candidatus Vidania fulgoroideae]
MKVVKHNPLVACSNHARPMIINKIYTDFSFEKGCINSSEFLRITKNLKNEKYIIVDFYSVSGISEFYDFFNKKNPPVLGCEIFLRENKRKYNISGKLLLIIESKIGFKNLKSIVNNSWRRYKKEGHLYSKFSDLKNQKGLIFLSGGQEGIYKNFENLSSEFLKKYTLFIKKKIPNFFIELQKFSNRCNLQFIKLLKLSKLTSTSVLFTHPVRFYKKENFEDFLNKYCIIKKSFVSNVKKKIFEYKNNFFLNKDKIYPIKEKLKIFILNRSISLDNNEQNFITYFKKQESIIKNPVKKLKKLIIKKSSNNIIFKSKRYRYRVLKEFNIIKNMGFSSHFLIVSKIINWSKLNNIIVGPGRGSGASSLVSYLLGITSINPIKHNLVFERFLNKKKKSIPDFDIDFCKEDRKRILEYIRSKFGKKKALNIVTFSSFSFKNTIRDCARTLGYRFSTSSNIIKNIEINNINSISELKKKCNCKDTVKILEASKGLEGRIKGVGTHAGGIVIDSNSEIPFFIFDKEKKYYLTQFDKKFLEKIGIIKLDILSLNTLSTLKKITKKINKNISFDVLNLEDKKTINLINEGKTTGVFQLESFGIKKFARRIFIKSFNDIVNLISLYRPGPISLLEKFVKKKKKRENDVIKNILIDTKGFIVFQEQIIEIARKIAGFSLDEADIFRNSISKNINLNIYKKKFVKGCLKNVSLDNAKGLFSEIKKLCGYSFNKSHAVSYSYITFYMAFLKAHNKLEFYKHSLDSSIKNKPKLKSLYEDCVENDLKLLKPDINKSNFNFKIENNSIRIGFCALKGLNKKKCMNILRERKKGEFNSIFDFLRRFERSTLRKNIIKILFFSNSLSCLEKNKEKLYYNINFYMKNNNINFYNRNQFPIFMEEKFSLKKVNIISLIKKENNILGINLKNIDLLIGNRINKIKKKHISLFHNKGNFLGILIGFKTVKENYLIITLEKKISVKRNFKIDKKMFSKRKLKIGDVILVFFNNYRYTYLSKIFSLIKIKKCLT